MVCKRYRATLGGLLLASCLHASPALAYVQPADAILSSVAKRRSEMPFKSLVVEGTWRGADGTEKPVWEAILANRARRQERRSRDGADAQVSLTRDNRRWSFDASAPGGASKPAIDDLRMAFFGHTERDPGGRRGLVFARRLGIDTEVVSLARLDGRIAYVIGAKPWEQDKPQLWIDKALLLPCRVIYKDGQEKVDVRLLDLGSAPTGAWYPRKVETYRGGNLVESTTYRVLRVNERVDAKLFAAPR